MAICPGQQQQITHQNRMPIRNPALESTVKPRLNARFEKATESLPSKQISALAAKLAIRQFEKSQQSVGTQ
jgi:hypothetical protein